MELGPLLPAYLVNLQIREWLLNEDESTMDKRLAGQSFQVSVCTPVHMRIHALAHTLTHTRMRARTHTHTCTHMHTDRQTHKFVGGSLARTTFSTQLLMQSSCSNLVVWRAQSSHLPLGSSTCCVRTPMCFGLLSVSH